jgi:hypothetical protein
MRNHLAQGWAWRARHKYAVAKVISLMLNAVQIPAGVDDVAVRKQLLNEFGIEWRRPRPDERKDLGDRPDGSREPAANVPSSQPSNAAERSGKKQIREQCRAANAAY